MLSNTPKTTMARDRYLPALAAFAALLGAPAHASDGAKQVSEARIAQIKAEAASNVQSQAKSIQVMVDQIFSFAEPGFQEKRSSEYLASILEKNGFIVERGVAGMPTAFKASWGSGGPLIALGADIDALLGLSQYPGVATITPMVEGAPGHGEGHNAGMPVIVAAAIAAKAAMQKHRIPGRLLIWPGVAEELFGSKAYYVREGLFDGVDACIFAHVSTGLGTGYGDFGMNGAVSVEYRFRGKAAHAASAPWEGRSALDAVELMNAGWNARREHLPLTQRSHHVITDGGEQPNVVPEQAAVWYFLRDRTFGGIDRLYRTANEIAAAAARMTDTQVEHRILGYAAPTFGNRPLAEAAQINIEKVGVPAWSDADRLFARAVQDAQAGSPVPLATKVEPLSTPERRGAALLGGSDDIGDVMWTVPTTTVFYPSNIPGIGSHQRAAAMAMATPIAHKGAVVGAKAIAMTVLDLMLDPALRSAAKSYFETVQLGSDRYAPLIGREDRPATWLNGSVMERLRPKMERFYYDPKRYPSYLDQLGIAYPPSPATAK